MVVRINTLVRVGHRRFNKGPPLKGGFLLVKVLNSVYSRNTILEEGSHSGRVHRSRKAESLYGDREFESHPFRIEFLQTHFARQVKLPKRPYFGRVQAYED